MNQNSRKVLKWEVKKRLEEIENRLFWSGQLRRSDLIEKFGISPQQASADIAHYQKLAPDNAVFNRSGKYYEPASKFAPEFISPSLDGYVEWAEYHDEGLITVPIPMRSINLSALRSITTAIHNSQSVVIEYQSMSSKEGSQRRITPHTIVFDGYRYHVRAYCHLRSDFRDFVFGRITNAGELSIPGLLKTDDEAWNTLVILRIAPHPELNASQRKIIEQDFNMKEGELQLRVRLAMLHYTLVQLRIDKFTEMRSPYEQQIVLLNKDVLSYLS